MHSTLVGQIQGKTVQMSRGTQCSIYGDNGPKSEMNMASHLLAVEDILVAKMIIHFKAILLSKLFRTFFDPFQVQPQTTNSTPGENSTKKYGNML